MSSWFIAAALLSLATCAIHVVAGGRFVARPLLQANDLGRIAKFTNYYCWHLVTIVLLMMSGTFAFAAADGVQKLAVLATLQAAAFAAWNIVLIFWKGLSPVRFPQWALFLLITVAGAIGTAWEGRLTLASRRRKRFAV